MAFRNAWFDDRVALQELPAECWADCSVPGQSADDAVAYWVRRLHFDGPAWLIRKHLSGYGAWSTCDLADHAANLERLLWVWACDCREAGGSVPLYLSH